MDRDHVAALDAERLVQHLGHRGEAVGRAGGVGDHRHVARDRLLVHPVDDGGVHPVGRGGDEHLASPRRQQLGGALLGREQAGALHRHVDALIGHLGRVAFRGDPDRPPSAPAVADGHGVPRHLDLTREAAVDAIVFEQVRVGLGAAQIVDGDRHEVVSPALDHRPQHQPSDATEPVDRDLHRHKSTPRLAGGKSLTRLVSLADLSRKER